jgi:uncharacterized protein YkwD
MSALQTRTNIAWLIVAGVIAALAVVPGVADARGWRPASAITAPTAAAQTAPARASQEACEASGARMGEASEAQISRATLCLLNRERAQRGLHRLRLNGRLSLAADRHSRDMVRRGYFSHDSLGGGSFVERIRRTGYLSSARSWTVGENLAWGSGGRGTPEQILNAWMRSPGHRANILSGRFREVGIGVAEGAPRTVGGPAATYTTNFGARS